MEIIRTNKAPPMPEKIVSIDVRLTYDEAFLIGKVTGSLSGLTTKALGAAISAQDNIWLGLKTALNVSGFGETHGKNYLCLTKYAGDVGKDGYCIAEDTVVVEGLRARIADLVAENAKMRAALDDIRQKAILAAG